jgi:phosphoglycolate phosphatase
MPANFQSVVFDFDYTLADSSRAVVECANLALRGLGLPERSADEIRRTIGLSIPNTLARLAGEEHRHKAEEFRMIWRRRSDEIMVDWTEVYPFVPGALQALSACGLRLGIVSTKFNQRIDEVLRREGLRDLFETIVGGDEVEHYKPHPQGLLKAIRDLECDPEGTVYVGDSVTDAETAQRAGAPFVAVLSGVTRRDEFDEFKSFRVLNDAGELPLHIGC